MIVFIEFVDGSKKEINVDDVCEGKQCLKYVIRYGPNEGEYSIPFCQIKTYKFVR